jgi:hypothetical protein
MATWTAKLKDNSYKMWLQDFLPTKFPKARISVYGYDANTRGLNTLRIREHGHALLQDLSRLRRNALEVLLSP